MIQESIQDRLESAKLTGIENGYGIGVDNRSSYRLGQFHDYLSECLETEQEHFRQFSPFNFTAQEFNRPVYFYDNDIDMNVVKEEQREWVNDDIWDSYDGGVVEGLEEAWKEWEVINALGAPA